MLQTVAWGMHQRAGGLLSQDAFRATRFLLCPDPVRDRGGGGAGAVSGLACSCSCLKSECFGRNIGVLGATEEAVARGGGRSSLCPVETRQLDRRPSLKREANLAKQLRKGKPR
jgi:hypothetical protein